MASCPRLHPQRSFCSRAVLPCSSDVVAGGTILLRCNVIRIGRGRPLPLRPLQAGHSSLLQRNLNRTRNSWSGGAGATPAAFFSGLCRPRGTSPRLRPQRSFCSRAVLPCSSDGVAGGPFFFAVTKISIGCGRPLPPWTLQAEPFFFAAMKNRPDAEFVVATTAAGGTILLCGNE